MRRDSRGLYPYNTDYTDSKHSEPRTAEVELLSHCGVDNDTILYNSYAFPVSTVSTTFS